MFALRCSNDARASCVGVAFTAAPAELSDQFGLEKAVIITHSDTLSHNQALKKNIKTISTRLRGTRHFQGGDLSRTKACKAELLRGRIHPASVRHEARWRIGNQFFFRCAEFRVYVANCQVQYAEQGTLERENEIRIPGHASQLSCLIHKQCFHFAQSGQLSVSCVKYGECSRRIEPPTDLAPAKRIL